MRAPAYTQSQSAFLDLLRYVLASAVVIGHGLGFFLGHFGGFFPTAFPHVQSIAVVCFFYLSGFLIVGSQLRHASEGGGTLTQYLFDRATRVYVTLVPSLVFVLVADQFFLHFASSPVDAGAPAKGLVVFLKNLLLVPSAPFGSMRPIWSLMYEWWIYLLFGGLFFLRSNLVAASLLTMAGLFCVSRLGLRSEAGHIWAIWALGGLMAYAHERCRVFSAHPKTLLGLAVALVLGAAWIHATTLQAYNLAAGILLSMGLFTLTVWSAGLSAAWLVHMSAWGKRLAAFSFTLFLTHYTVLVHTRTFLDGWAGLLVGVLLSNLVALAIASVTEFKLSTLKRWLVQRARHWRSDRRSLA